MANENQAQETQQTQSLTREQRLEIEEKAIQALLDMGVRFSVPLKYSPGKAPWWVRLWNHLVKKYPIAWRDRRIPKSWNDTIEEIPDTNKVKMEMVYMRHFQIKPLYLGTIDKIRQLYLQIEYDEETIQQNPLQETKKLYKYIHIVSQIAAVAIVNNPEVATDSKAVKSLARFIENHVTVPKLRRLSDVISQMMDPGGFTSSIRSIREVGVTRPNPNTKANLIEK